jgi:hypothetical protein
VQIVGRPFEDELVLGIAAAVEASFGYKPPLLSVTSEILLAGFTFCEVL